MRGDEQHGPGRRLLARYGQRADPSPRGPVARASPGHPRPSPRLRPWRGRGSSGAPVPPRRGRKGGCGSAGANSAEWDGKAAGTQGRRDPLPGTSPSDASHPGAAPRIDPRGPGSSTAQRRGQAAAHARRDPAGGETHRAGPQGGAREPLACETAAERRATETPAPSAAIPPTEGAPPANPLACALATTSPLPATTSAATSIYIPTSRVLDI